MSAAPTPGLKEATEAARRIERERYIGSAFVADARTLAKFVSSLSSPPTADQVSREYVQSREMFKEEE